MWPEKPTVHEQEARHYPSREPAWLQPRGRRDDSDPYCVYFRTCSWCGSIHPEDLANLAVAQPVPDFDDWVGEQVLAEVDNNPKAYHERLAEHLQKQGSTFNIHSADWKYGWPHKFYIDGIPNPIAGEPYSIYALSANRENLGEDAQWYVFGNGQSTWRERVGTNPCPTTIRAKWYNIHLADRDMSEEAFGIVVNEIARFTGISFIRDPEIDEALGRYHILYYSATTTPRSSSD
jgi:hypothetical protein